MVMGKTPCRRPGYQIEVNEDKACLSSPTQERVLHCNETASLIWQLCDGEHTGDEIISMLITLFPEAADVIPNDVEATLLAFRKYGAISFK